MNPIAIIGVGAVFPGATTPQAYWQNLLNGVRSAGPATQREMGVDPDIFFDPKPGQVDRYYCKQGGYVRDFTFDPTGYHLPAKFLTGLANIFQWSLQTAREALAFNGYANNSNLLQRCGLVMGNLSFPTRASNDLFLPLYHRSLNPVLSQSLGHTLTLPTLGPVHAAANPYNALSAGYPAGIVAQALGLGGLHFALDAACASSLYAVKLACDHLNSGQADLMLAGAVSGADPFFIHLGFSTFRAYPENGQANPLSTDSDGLFAGQGAGMFVLKRLADAQQDGDNILGIIRGAGLSNDGRGKSLLSPNPKGQLLAFSRAYADAQLSPTDVDFVECHATGTPLGDKTEVASIETFFGDAGHLPYLGSAKSNLGHLLTAAGMAGMLKVILAMQQRTIPPTPNLTAPHTGPQGKLGPAQMVSRPIDWPTRPNSPPRAGVSAFGFGGTNAHLILETPTESPDPGPVQAPPSPQPLAIVGMAAHFGPFTSLTEFNQATFHGKQGFGPLPGTRWQGIEKRAALLADYGLNSETTLRGAFIEHFDLDFLRFKIPPIPGDQPIPQQLLLLKVVDAALTDANLGDEKNIAVIAAMGTELALHQVRGRCDLTWQLPAALAAQGIDLSAEEAAALETLAKDSIDKPAQVNQYISAIGNIMASRVAAHRDLNGPAFTLSAEENSVFKALAVAQLLLNSGSVAAVAIGAVDLAGGIENVLLRNRLAPLNDGPATISFDARSTGWLIGEGAGAVVLTRTADATDQRVYATIAGLGLAQATIPAANATQFPYAPPVETIAAAMTAAHQQAGVAPANIGYLEANAAGFADFDAAEMAAIQQHFNGHEKAVAVGSAKGTVGHTFNAAGMAGLIRAALALHNRYLPAAPNWESPKDAAAWNTTTCYIPSESRPWFGDGSRYAAVNGLGIDGSAAQVILQSAPTAELAQACSPLDLGAQLFLLGGSTPADFVAALSDLRTATASTPLPMLAATWWHTWQRTAAPLTLALIAADAEALNKEIDRATNGLPKAFAAGTDWKTPAGSYFSPQPQGQAGDVALVYAGAFNTYGGAGRALLYHFPHVAAKLPHLLANDGHLLGGPDLYPRQMSALTKAQRQQFEAKLLTKSAFQLESSVGYAQLMTHILRDVFDLQPQAAMGYSLGESTMMFALDAWDYRRTNSDALRASDVFQGELDNPHNAVRRAWGLPLQAAPVDEDLWGVYILKTNPARAAEAVAATPQVYLTHINTPEQVIIAGDPAACEAVITQLGTRRFRAPYNQVIHAAPAESTAATFARLNTLPIKRLPALRYYFAADDGSPLNSESIGRRIGQGVTRQLDFRGLLDRAYTDGTRVFVEIGIRDATTKLIERNLKGRPGVAVAGNKAGTADGLQLLRLLATLSAHAVPLNLASLFLPTESNPPARRIVRQVQVGGTPIDEAFAGITPTSPELVEGGTAWTSSAGAVPKFKPSKVALERIPETADKKETGSASTNSADNAPTAASPTRKFANSPQEDLVPQATNLSPAGQRHADYLTAQQETIQSITTALEAHLQAAPVSTGPQWPAHVPVADYTTPAKIIWDKADLETFAAGDIAAVFGPEYGIIDSYSRRVRLPMYPYLLVTRVTDLNATPNVYEPCDVQTEYDIPLTPWYATDGQAPLAVTVESGQCDLLLISYLGIDFQAKGERVYRLLDCTLTFKDNLPLVGQTLRYDIHIDSFARSGDSVIFFFSYECYVKDKMILQMTNGCAGFFTDEELAKGKGVIRTKQELDARAQVQPGYFEPFLTTAKTSFERSDLQALIQGDLAGCFGPAYAAHAQRSLRFPPEQMLMLDKISKVEPQGGLWGLGWVEAELSFAPDDWFFPCHFKDDEVMAGSLMAEGCGQLLQFYLLYLGMQTQTRSAKFRPIKDLSQIVRSRGQVTPAHGTLHYKMEITELGLSPHPFAKANVDIVYNGKTIVDFRDLGFELVEREED